MTTATPTPQAILDGILADVAIALDGIEHRPRMYGGESLEFQALAAVELRQRILRPTWHAIDPSETTDAWHAFGALVIGEVRSVYLYAVLREEGMLDRLPGLLGDAARWIAREYPPEGTARKAGEHAIRWSDFGTHCRDCLMASSFRGGTQVYRMPGDPWSAVVPSCTRADGGAP